MAHLFNPFPNKPWFLRVCSTSLLKTMWAISPFPTVFSTVFIQYKIVVCKLSEIGRVENLSFGKGLKGSEVMQGNHGALTKMPLFWKLLKHDLSC